MAVGVSSAALPTFCARLSQLTLAYRQTFGLEVQPGVGRLLALAAAWSAFSDLCAQLADESRADGDRVPGLTAAWSDLAVGASKPAVQRLALLGLPSNLARPCAAVSDDVQQHVLAGQVTDDEVDRHEQPLLAELQAAAAGIERTSRSAAGRRFLAGEIPSDVGQPGDRGGRPLEPGATQRVV